MVTIDKSVFFAKNIKLEDLDNPELRSENCGNLASKLAEIKMLRKNFTVSKKLSLKKNGCCVRRKRYRKCYLP